MTYEMQIFLNGINCRIKIFKRTKKHITFRAVFKDFIHIGVPRRFAIKDVPNLISQNRQILIELMQRAERFQENEVKSIFYLGEKYNIQSLYSRFRLPEKVDSRIELVQKLKQQAEQILLQRLQFWTEKTQLSPDGIGLSQAKSYWGICRKKRILLNWRLIGAPLDVIDYVCVHELCHLVYANHSVLFWNKVNSFYPEMSQAKKWLKINGKDLLID